MRVSSSIHLIEEASDSNVYLVAKNGLAMIDAGGSGNLGIVEEYVGNLGGKIGDLSHIFLTHSHVDHVSSAPEIAERSGAKTLAHELDSPYISGEEKRGTLMRIGDFLSGKPKFDVDVRVSGGEEIRGFEVIHTPGHTEGSVSFFYREEGALFLGDAVRNDGGLLFGEEGKLTLSPGIFSESEEEMKSSVERIKEVDPELLLPGHGPPVLEGVSERVDELIDSL